MASLSSCRGHVAHRTNTSRCRTVSHRPSLTLRNSRRLGVQVQAMLTPDGKDKKVLKREEEPEEYWTSKSERAGANPFKDPLAVIGILAIFFPFLLLLVAGATGLIDFSVYR